MSKPCIVVYDDEMGICSPYGFDPDCEGALSTDEPIVVFADRKTARASITISRKWAELQKAQGVSYNTDFIDSKECIKIRPVALIGFTAADVAQVTQN